MNIFVFKIVLFVYGCTLKSSVLIGEWISRRFVREFRHLNLVIFRRVPAAFASVGEVALAGIKRGQGSNIGRWHDHHYTGEPEEGGSRGDQESRRDWHNHAGSGNCVAAVSVAVLCLQQHLLHHGGSQPGLTADLHWLVCVVQNPNKRGQCYFRLKSCSINCLLLKDFR